MTVIRASFGRPLAWDTISDTAKYRADEKGWPGYYQLAAGILAPENAHKRDLINVAARRDPESIRVWTHNLIQ